MNGKFLNLSRVCQKKLERVVAFCKVQSLPPVNLIVKTSKKSFYAYFQIPKNRIVIGIGAANHFPCKVFREKKFIKEGYSSGFLLASQEEALIYLLSHEVRHLWQMANPKKKRLGISQFVYSEEDAELYALKKLDKWRIFKHEYRTH